MLITSMLLAIVEIDYYDLLKLTEYTHRSVRHTKPRESRIPTSIRKTTQHLDSCEHDMPNLLALELYSEVHLGWQLSPY